MKAVPRDIDRERIKRFFSLPPDAADADMVREIRRMLRRLRFVVSAGSDLTGCVKAMEQRIADETAYGLRLHVEIVAKQQRIRTIDRRTFVMRAMLGSFYEPALAIVRPGD